MTIRRWVAALVGGLGLYGSKRRSSVWSAGAAKTVEVQSLESRQLMSAVNTISELTGVVSYGDNSAAGKPGVNVGTQESTAVIPNSSGTAVLDEDLFDEGAGAVWGGLMQNLSSGGHWSLMPPAGGLADGPGIADLPPASWGGGWGGGTTGGGGATTGGGTTGGGGGTGGGPGTGPLPRVSISSSDPEAYEGPYTASRLDEAVFRLKRSGGDLQRTLAVRVELNGTATPGVDYRITDVNRELIEPDPFSVGTPWVTITIPAGQDYVDFKMLTNMDSQFEAEESFLPTVTRSATGQYEPEGTTFVKAKILDKTADIDIASAEDRKALLSDMAEDDPGATIFVNSDFDAQQAIHDKAYYAKDVPRFASAEDDVLNMTITSHLQNGNDADVSKRLLRFSITHDASKVRLYRPLATNTPEQVTWIPITPLDTFSLTTGTTMELRVEALAPGDGSIGLNWYDVALGNPIRQFDSVKYTSWDVDIDLDSNNNQALAVPERNDWEEFLEDNTYGIGKIIYPNRPDPLIDHDPQRFTPVAFRTQPESDKVGVRFVWKDFQGESGEIRLWTVPSNVEGGLKPTPLENGGHLITQGRVYTSKEFAQIKGLWIEATVAQTQYNTMAGVEIKRPDDRLRMDLMHRIHPSAAWKLLRSDEARYLVCDNADRFYPNLQFDHPERYWDSPAINTGVVMRDSLISEGVYGARDMPQFGQQLLGLKDLFSLGVPVDTAIAISRTRTATGLKCEIYRDYLSVTGTDYVLAFAGTEIEFEDIASDVLQGLGLEGAAFLEFAGFESQYPKGMKIAAEVAEALRKKGIALRFTGHSLGGGLASAAAIATNHLRIPTNTFNAAGLHRNTITQRDALGFLMPKVPRYKGAFEAFERELAGNGVIKAFNMQFDPLTLLQRHSPSIKLLGQIPVALGQSIVLKGPYSVVESQGAIRLRAAVESMPAPLPNDTYITWYARFSYWLDQVGEDSQIAIKNILYQHKIRTCQYGLMVEEIQVPARTRKFDIFGYGDPNKT